MDAREQTLERLDKLIEKGDKIAQSLSKPSLYNSATADAVGWRAQIAVSVNDICGENSPYTSVLISQGQHRSIIRNVTGSLAILRSVREDIEHGYMQTYRQLIAAEFLGDLFEQAEYLHENGHFQAAASIGAAGLESGLREVVKSHSITLKSREDLNSLADKLLGNGVISQLERRQFSFLTGVRNAADHGDFDNVTADDVAKLIRDSRDLLAKHAT